MLTLGVILNQETKKAVGVILHDDQTGRILMKVRPSDESLLRMFNLWINKPIIEQVREEIKGQKLTRRMRVLPTEPQYVKFLTDRFVKPPYIMGHYSHPSSTHLDSTLEESYRELVDHTLPKAVVPVYINPFAT
jgi:hypothetical protein